MKSRRFIVFAAVFVGLLLTGNAYPEENATDQPQQEPMKQGTQQDPGASRLVRASSLVLIGDQIKAVDGEVLGRVEDLLVDPGSGQVRFVVMSGDGVARRDQLIPIPANAFKVDSDSGVLLLAMNTEVLAKAPSFTRNQWPDTADGKWAQGVDEYYAGGDKPQIDPASP